MVLPLSALLACAPPEFPNGDSGVPGTDAPALAPDWTANEAVGQLQAALDGGLPPPTVARDAFLDLIETGQDNTCPGTTDFNGAEPLGCTSEAGYLYAGISEYREDPDGWSLGGDFEIREPDGDAYHGAGHVFVHSDGWGWMTEFTGTWSHDGGDGWLDPGRSGMFTAMGSNGRVELDGGFDLAGTFVHFDGVVVEDQADHSATGTVGVRDPAGAWWWLTLGDDGCGALTFSLEDQGTGCIDLNAAIGDWADGMLP